MILIQISMKIGKWAGVVQTLGYGLGDRGSISGLGNDGIFPSLHHRVQTGSGAHPASYTMFEADHSPPSNAEVKNAWSYTSTHNMSS
jgi:hypothetical protein